MPTKSRRSLARSVDSFSSRRVACLRRIAPRMPLFRRVCIPESTLSTALIVPKSLMFWKVRPIPICARWWAFRRVMSLSSKTKDPEVGPKRPLTMLKNVVFPAPLGPIRLTIDRSGMSKFTELTATRPPKTFVMPRASSRALWPSGSGTGAPHRVAGAGVVVAQLLLALAVGDDALGPEQHHQHEDQAEDKEVVAGQVHVAHRRAAYRVADGVNHRAQLRQGVEVDALQHDGAEDHAVDVPHPPEHDHAKYQYGDIEREGVGEDVLDERPVERAGESPEEGAQGVGPQLRRYWVYAHGRGGRLVLAHRDPGSSEPGV